MLKRTIILTLGILFFSCSNGVRIKNIVNYPLSLLSIEGMDTLRVLPDVVKYTGVEEAAFHNFKKDIRIVGRQDRRPEWKGGERGCFLVNSGASVHILDFNFSGGTGDTALIRVDSGRVILENCDLNMSEGWSIQIGPLGKLELRNVRFSNLGKGGILVDGGQVRIYNSTFDQAGKSAIYSHRGQLLELHKVEMTNNMGTALELNSVEEVWLDSVKVIDSFEDGMSFNDCDFILLNDVESRGNGRNGLNINNSRVCGFLNYSALGNMVYGIEVQNVDTLQILNSEFVGNGDSGALLHSVNQSRIAGISVGYNGDNGLQASNGKKIVLQHSTFQSNPKIGLQVDSLENLQIAYTSWVNNDDGILVNQVAKTVFEHNMLSSNKGNAAQFNKGNHVILRINLLEENQTGFVIENVADVQLDSNRIVNNKVGTDIRSASQVAMSDNIWKDNELASYFSSVGSITSQFDQWQRSLNSALEVLSTGELIISNAVFSGNQKGGLLNQVPARVESSTFDSNLGFGLKIMNGSLFVDDSKFQSNNTGIMLAEGSQANILQCNFVSNDLAIDALASTSLSLSYSNITSARGGIQVGNYGVAMILSNSFEEIDDYCLQITGPYLQSLVLRQNIFSQTGGILKSRAESGEIIITNNTFISSGVGFNARKNSLSRVDYNIFFKTEFSEVWMLEQEKVLNWNCFDPETFENHSIELRENNIYANPLFDEGYYLKPQSPCLKGGKSGTLIGALGLLPENRPSLQP